MSARKDPAPCPACGNLNLPGEIFCQQCGVVLGPVSGQPPPLPRALGRSELAPVPERPPLPGVVSEAIGQPLEATIPESGPAPETVTGCLRSRDSGKRFIIPSGQVQVLIGRADAAEEFFPDIDLEPVHGEQMGVSRRHALLTAQTGQVFLEDLNSTNFTFINHQVLPPGQRKAVKAGDVLQFGHLMLIFEVCP